MGDIGGFGQKSAAKEARGSARENTNARLKTIKLFGQPANFAQYLGQVNQQLANLYEPARRQSAEAAALGEQTALQDIDTTAGRGGLEGSGIIEWLKQGAKGGRQARTNEALSNYWVSRNRDAQSLAKQMQSEIVAGMAGVPLPNTPGIPSAGAMAADTGLNILSLYLMGGGLGGGTSAAASPYASQGYASTAGVPGFNPFSAFSA